MLVSNSSLFVCRVVAYSVSSKFQESFNRAALSVQGSQCWQRNWTPRLPGLALLLRPCHSHLIWRATGKNAQVVCRAMDNSRDPSLTARQMSAHLYFNAIMLLYEILSKNMWVQHTEHGHALNFITMDLFSGVLIYRIYITNLNSLEYLTQLQILFSRGI